MKSALAYANVAASPFHGEIRCTDRNADSRRSRKGNEVNIHKI